MAEIADWSPVDESNNSAPPVGAPENMAPSAVNNVMRAMQGSIRRWYDTITTQLATYLPLSGGTVTGDTTFTGPNGININGMMLNNNGLNALEVSHPTVGGIAATGPNAHLGFGDRDMVSAAWLWYANTGTAHLLRADGSDIITVSWAGQVWITGNLAVSGNQTINGSLGASGNVTGNGLFANAITSNGDITAGDDITATGDITGNGLFANAIISNGDITAGNDINATGDITANTVTANALTSNGSIAVAGTANVGNVSASGTVSTNALTASGNSTLTNVHIVGGINAIGNDSNFYIRRTGGEYVIAFEPNTYLMFNSATNNFSIVIDGVTKASW